MHALGRLDCEVCSPDALHIKVFRPVGESCLTHRLDQPQAPHPLYVSSRILVHEFYVTPLRRPAHMCSAECTVQVGVTGIRVRGTEEKMWLHKGLAAPLIALPRELTGIK